MNESPEELHYRLSTAGMAEFRADVIEQIIAERWQKRLDALQPGTRVCHRMLGITGTVSGAAHDRHVPVDFDGWPMGVYCAVINLDVLPAEC